MVVQTGADGYACVIDGSNQMFVLDGPSGYVESEGLEQSF